MSLLKTVLPFFTNQTMQFISHGIGCSYFSQNLLLSFLLWYGFKIQVKLRGGDIFFYLALSVNIRQKYFFFFNWKLNVLSCIVLIWPEKFWIWFSQKFTKTLKFLLFFKVIIILPPIWLSNLGSDLSIDNILQLDSADTKIITHDAVNKVLEFTERWKYPNFRGKF